MENVVQKESKLRRVVQTGKDKNRPDVMECNDSVAALKLQLNEAVFLGRFMGAISSTLDPADICSIASRWIYDYIPYLRIVFNLSQEFCMETLAFSPGGAKTSEVDQTKGNPLLELRSEECKNTLNMGMPCLFDGGVRCRRYSVELSNAMGTIVIFFEELMVGDRSEV